ncbi:hypothetical protein A9Q84_06150 [Halobacteriovorax marinus]|uniref:HIT domain-containing protein n=1 Tax=Halobacteriovorax marinus TaxID=97084 RepID=A0A1Y5F9A9_9BACT|nr:hypothetical protein A9Q84_06150 [Halobacteriovorax marinus]
MSKCVFCEILEGNIPASFVYKDEFVTSFMDLNPINKGHLLIVPNIHASKFTDVAVSIVPKMFEAAQQILKAIESSDIPCSGANLFLSDGEVAGQEVPHSHLHIAPRFEGDTHRMGFSGNKEIESNRASLDQTAEMIKIQL